MSSEKQLHWTQRIALIQHNLHAASRTGNFTFFTNIQSAHFVNGKDYVANLSATLGDEADKLFSVLDNLNSGIAWSHEDAFKTVYDGLKDAVDSNEAVEDHNIDQTKALLERLHCDITAQRAQADTTIDKMMTSAVTIIQQQPPEVHENAAHVFMLGTTFIADAVQVCLSQLHVLETCVPESNMARAESAYSLVRFAVSAAVSALKGVLNMMETHDDPAGEAAAAHARRTSTASMSSLLSPSRAISHASTDQLNGHLTANNAGSGNNAAWNVFRRMSTAFSGNPGTSRKGAKSPSPQRPQTNAPADLSAETSQDSMIVLKTPTFVTPSLKSPPHGHKRGVSMPMPKKAGGRTLSPIMATPAGDSTEALKNPFETSFALGRKREGNIQSDVTNKSLPTLPTDDEAEPPPAVNERAFTSNQEVAEAEAGTDATAASNSGADESAKFVNDHAEGQSSAVDPLTLNHRRTSSNMSNLRHGRRRSTEVRGTPPDLQTLKVASPEAEVSV